MTVLTRRVVSPEEYDRAEAEFFRLETIEDMSESADSFTQRAITLSALQDLKTLHFPEMDIFNEFMLIYTLPKGLGRVTPDNFITLGLPPQKWKSSFPVTDVQLPFWVLEYVSPPTQNKDYVKSFGKYEDLQIPYCTLFDPCVQKLTMFQYNGHRYEPMLLDERRRYLISELDLHVGLLDGWMRFWFRGQLLPTAAEAALQREGDALKMAESRERNRRRVAKLATAAGRTDIAAQAQHADADQLEQWLDELTG